MSALLAMREVSAGYVADIHILRRVSLEIAPGVITGLIGLNGAGKSTILKTICGFLPPRDGIIRFDGQNITSIAAHRVIDCGISYIPQESSLFPHMSVAANIGITPNNDGKIMRLVFPALTEERRKELVKIVRKLAEDFKVSWKCGAVSRSEA